MIQGSDTTTLMQTVVVTFVEALAGVIVVDSDAVVDSAFCGCGGRGCSSCGCGGWGGGGCGWGVELGFGFIFGITLVALFFLT